MTLNISWDVDGVVLDMVGGFCRWLERKHRVILLPEQITHYEMRKIDPVVRTFDSNRQIEMFSSGTFSELMGGGLENYLHDFLNSYDCYQGDIDWCQNVTGKKYGENSLDSLIYRFPIGARHVFLTATIAGLSNSLDSKMRRLLELFADIPVINCPSKLKQMWCSDFHIDDRADICRKFWESGRDAFCIKRPWSVLDGSEPANRVGTMAECISCVDSLIQKKLATCPEVPYHHEEWLDGR